MVVDQVQMLYDGLDLKKINHDIPVAGDLAYYNGKYFNASGRYFTATNGLPLKGEGSNPLSNDILNEESGFYIDPSQMNFNSLFADLTLYGRLTNVAVNKIPNSLKYYTAICTAVGLLHQTKGNYIKAQTLLNIAIHIRAENFGNTSPEFVNSLHNLAVLKTNLGEYSEAEKMFRYLVPTAKTLYEYTSPSRYAAVLNNSAMLFAQLGRTDEAIRQLELAIKIGKEGFYDNYIDFERVLTNRAFIANEAGDKVLAEELYKKVLAGMEAKGFDSHPDYNNALIYYGALLVEKGENNLEAFLDEVIEKIGRRYKNDHPLYAKALLNKADYYLEQNRFDKAFPILKEAKNAQLSSLGDKHKDYLKTLIKLGTAQWYLQDVESANLSFNEAIAGYLFQLKTFFRGLSENEQSDLWGTMKPAIDNYMAFAISNAGSNPDLIRQAYNLQIKTKGLLLNNTTKTKNAILNSNDSSLTLLYRQYISTKKLLGTYYNFSKEELNEEKVNLEELESLANDLERKLTQKTNLVQADDDDIKLQTVTSWLSEGEAAIEMIRVPISYGFEKGSVRYAAIIIRPNAEPRLVALNNGKELEDKYLKFYKNAIQLKVTDTETYPQFWAPIQQQLADVKTAYLSLDGVYNNLNINTLKIDESTYVLDKINLLNIPNTKQINQIKSSKVALNETEKATLFGFPKFGNDEKVVPLPGTREEIQEIDKLLVSNNVSTDLFMEYDASEENFLKIKSPNILHVATHGFFLPDVDLGDNMIMGTNVSKAKDNPLLRSGLLLSGAANALSDTPEINSGNNGVLNAFEIMNLDLSGTGLVIMSACETGNGEVVNGEGVYGLNRAFQVAGADKIIMSLWKVDDEATKDLMTSFYKNWLEVNDAQLAFVNAQKQIKIGRAHV